MKSWVTLLHPELTFSYYFKNSFNSHLGNLLCIAYFAGKLKKIQYSRMLHDVGNKEGLLKKTKNKKSCQTIKKL